MGNNLFSIFIISRFVGVKHPLDTSPMIIQGPDLPNLLYGHCVVNSFDAMKALITGGKTSGGFAANAFHIFSFDDQTWQQGPPLTGKSFSEALTLASTNPQYDKRLFIDLPVQYMKTTSSEHAVYMNCSECQNKNQFVYTTCSELVVFMY